MRFLHLTVSLLLGLSTPLSAAEKTVQSPKQGSLKPFRKPGQPYAVGTPYLGGAQHKQKVQPAPPVNALPTRPPQVTTQTFRRLSKNLGEWSGVVQGSGEVHLNLRILRDGKVESVRYIGFVPLKQHTSTFHFRSPIPQGAGWTWRVVAYKL